MGEASKGAQMAKSGTASVWVLEDDSYLGVPELLEVSRESIQAKSSEKVFSEKKDALLEIISRMKKRLTTLDDMQIQLLDAIQIARDEHFMENKVK